MSGFPVTSFVFFDTEFTSWKVLYLVIGMEMVSFRACQLSAIKSLIYLALMACVYSINIPYQK